MTEKRWIETCGFRSFAITGATIAVHETSGMPMVVEPNVFSAWRIAPNDLSQATLQNCALSYRAIEVCRYQRGRKEINGCGPEAGILLRKFGYKGHVS